jgi:hypothetical protein
MAAHRTRVVLLPHLGRAENMARSLCNSMLALVKCVVLVLLSTFTVQPTSRHDNMRREEGDPMLYYAGA